VKLRHSFCPSTPLAALFFNAAMPRSGADVVSDLPRGRLCRIACARCGRAGAYRPETLAARFGDMALPDVLIALTVCERRGDYSRPCGAGYTEPLGAARGLTAPA
jgi:hypothetical protein